MAEFKVENIANVEPDAFNGLTKTNFLSGGQLIYMFTKPGNEPKEGDTLDGTVAADKAGKLKFTKTKTQDWQGAGAPSRYTGPKKGQSFGGGRDDNAIKAQWAIGQAVQLRINESPGQAVSLSHVEQDAKALYVMIGRVKDSDQAPAAQTQLPVAEGRVFTDEEAQAAADFMGGEIEA